jgi:prophage regulatory protein
MAEQFKEALIRREEVQRRIGLKRSALYEAVARGDFPAPVKISARAVAWIESDVSRWISETITRARNAANAK